MKINIALLFIMMTIGVCSFLLSKDIQQLEKRVEFLEFVRGIEK